MSKKRALLWGAVLMGTALSISGNAGREPAQETTAGEWAQSKDPCYPTKKFKKMIKDQFGKEAAYIKCFPVEVEVIWQVEETRAWHKPYPTEKAWYRLEEKFTAYCQLVYEQQKQKELEEISIIGPAPCCPGNVEAWFFPYDISYLVTDAALRKGFLVSTVNFAQFVVTVPEDNFFGCTWSKASGQSSLTFGSSHIALRDGLVKSPLRLRSGLKVVEGASLKMDKKGKEAFSYEDLLEALNNGECLRYFQSKESEPLPSNMGSYSRTVLAMVKLSTAERERWRVTVKGWERDDTQPAIRYKLAGQEKELPIRMEFDWLLMAEFAVRKVKPLPVYDKGQVKQASLRPKLVFQGGDLYGCEFVNCPDPWPISTYVGAYLDGKLDGQKLTLKWASFNPAQCVLCKPKKGYLSQVPYRQKFGSQEFMAIIDHVALVLKDGFAVSGHVQDWLTYTITLKKIG